MGILIFIVAILGDFAAIWFRYWIGSTIGGPTVGYALAFLPQLWSLLTLVGVPSGNTLTRLALGAREPSERERMMVEPIIRVLTTGTGARGPRRWYVLDEPLVEAAVAGTTLFVNRALIDTPHLQPVVAHELGHLNSLDGRLTLALQRTIFPGGLLLLRLFDRIARKPTEWAIDPRTGEQIELRRAARGGAFGCLGSIGVILSFVFMGGLPLMVLNMLRILPAYWRDREYAADAYAARLGEAGPLVYTLDELRELDMATPWLPWSTRTHPYTELRVDRLLRLERAEQVTTLAGRAGSAVSMALLGVVLVPLMGCWYVSVSLGALRPGGVDVSMANGAQRTTVTDTSGEASIATTTVPTPESMMTSVVENTPQPTTATDVQEVAAAEVVAPATTVQPSATSERHEPCGAFVVIDGGGAKIHADTNYNGTVLDRVPRGGSLEVLCDVAPKLGGLSWRKVRAGTVKGWVLIVLIAPTSSVPDAAPAIVPTAVLLTGTADDVCGTARISGVDALAIRAQPTRQSTQLGTVNRDGVVKVLCVAPVDADERTWRRVRSGGVEGWMSTRYLAIVEERQP